MPRLSFIITLLFSGWLGISNAPAQFRVAGSIVNEAGEPVTGAQVKVKRQGTLLFFRSLSNTHVFAGLVPWVQTGDTLVVTVHHHNHQPFTRVWVPDAANSSAEFIVTLAPLPRQLKEVVIQPSVWKRGDTTFFAVDSFRTGEEQKLRDIIRKLPGFQLSDEGDLRFRGKPVAKILIEGETLFADRVRFLLESFPVHMLQQVEAIENNPKNRLLKGLSLQNETVVNLKVHREAAALFGDLEARLTTNPRYAVNPTLFALRKKTKLGLAGHNHNMGSLSETLQEKGEAEEQRQLPVLQPQGIHKINNFSGNRYILNRMASNQLTLQHTIATHWKIKTEAEFSTDRLHQAVVSAQLLVDSTRIVRRREEQAFLSKQTQWRINQEVEFNPGSNRQFKGNVSYLQRVHNQEHTRIIEQGTISESIPSLFSGHTSVWQGSLLFTHRLNGQKARTLAYTFHRELFTPRQEAQNSQYPLLLSSPPGFQQAQLNQQALWLRQELKWESFRKRGHHIRSGHYFLRHQSLMVNHRFELGTEQQPAQQKIEALSGQSWLEGVEIGYGSEVKYERSSRFRFNMNGELGLSAMSRREWEVRRQLMPLVRGKALVFRKLNRVFSLSSHLQADLQPLPLTSQVQFRRAVSPLQFQESRLPLMAIPEYLMILNLGYSESLMRTSGLQFYFRQRLVSELFMPSYNGLLSWNTLSLVKQPTNLYNVTLYKTVFFAVQKRKLDFSASSSINEFLQINQDARTIKTAFLFSSLSASFETEYGNHHFVRTSLWATRFQTLSFIKNDAGFGRSLLRYRAEFFNRYRVSARASIAASCQYFHFRPAVAQPLTLVFADVVATWRPGKWKHDITFKGENLLNQKSYLLLTGSAFEVSQTSIPLIGRNLQVAVKFNF